MWFFKTNCTGIEGLAALLVPEGGAVCPPLEVGCHVTPLEVASDQPGEDVSVAAPGTDRAWQVVMNFV